MGGKEEGEEEGRRLSAPVTVQLCFGFAQPLPFLFSCFDFHNFLVPQFFSFIRFEYKIRVDTRKIRCA